MIPCWLVRICSFWVILLDLGLLFGSKTKAAESWLNNAWNQDTLRPVIIALWCYSNIYKAAGFLMYVHTIDKGWISQVEVINQQTTVSLDFLSKGGSIVLLLLSQSLYQHVLFGLSKIQGPGYKRTLKAVTGLGVNQLNWFNVNRLKHVGNALVLSRIMADPTSCMYRVTVHWFHVVCIWVIQPLMCKDSCWLHWAVCLVTCRSTSAFSDNWQEGILEKTVAAIKTPAKVYNLVQFDEELIIQVPSTRILGFYMLIPYLAYFLWIRVCWFVAGPNLEYAQAHIFKLLHLLLKAQWMSFGKLFIEVDLKAHFKYISFGKKTPAEGPKEGCWSAGKNT
ncbi:hypothetical protein HanRHA438_Chr09g0373011 [Helianthus annuus]|nr:hypothetical protein HanRHA438_Chr09g0373011 [Helianthus annuus]